MPPRSSLLLPQTLLHERTLMAVVSHIGTWVESNPSGHPLSDAFAAIMAWISTASEKFAAWIARPGMCRDFCCKKVLDFLVIFLGYSEVWTLVIIWFIVFWIVLTIPLVVGFGPSGVMLGEFPWP
jgi:hypothetical protein